MVIPGNVNTEREVSRPHAGKGGAEAVGRVPEQQVGPEPPVSASPAPQGLRRGAGGGREARSR